ncbi:MAG TPA: oligosaccharide flippase family protein [Lysobacter sp.]
MSTPSERTLVGQPTHAGAGAPAAAPVGLGKHYLRYSSATILTTLAGLISFPALTRLLDNTQFGILGYYDTWLMMAVTIIKLGGQHAILRMYPFGADGERLTHFTTNLVFLPMMVSVGLWLIGVTGLSIAAAAGVLNVQPVFWGAVILLPMLVFTSQVEMTLRVSERSGLLTLSRITWRWLELVLIVGVVALFQRSALAVYVGKVASALILVAFYAFWVSRNLKFSRSMIDWGTYRRSLRYSLPLVVNEIAAVSMISIDRIMLRHQTGDYAAVGVFTIGCALAMQISTIMSDPLWNAFNPVINRVHGTDGAAEVRALKSKVLLPVTYACIGIGAGIWAVGPDVLTMLAGADKSTSGPVFAWLGAMFAMLPLLDVTGYGLLLHHRSVTVLVLTGLAALLNIGLNLVWIPVFGVMGAVYATVVAYAALSLGRCIMCPRELLQLPNARTLATAVGAAALFILVLRTTDVFGISAPWLRTIVSGLVWLATFLVPAVLLDPRLRRLLIERGRSAAA